MLETTRKRRASSIRPIRTKSCWPARRRRPSLPMNCEHLSLIKIYSHVEQKSLIILNILYWENWLAVAASYLVWHWSLLAGARRNCRLNHHIFALLTFIYLSEMSFDNFALCIYFLWWTHSRTLFILTSLIWEQYSTRKKKSFKKMKSFVVLFDMYSVVLIMCNFVSNWPFLLWVYEYSYIHFGFSFKITFFHYHPANNLNIRDWFQITRIIGVLLYIRSIENLNHHLIELR